MIPENDTLSIYRRLTWIGALIFFNLSAAFSPTLSLFAKHLGLSVVEVGLLFALPAVLGIAYRLPAATLSSRWGRKRVLCIGILACALSPLIVVLLPNVIGIFLTALFYGAAHFFAPVAVAWIHDLSLETQKGRAFGFFSMRSGVGRAIGPLLAGILLQLTASFQLIYLMCSMSALIALALAASLPRGTFYFSDQQTLQEQFSDDVKTCFSTRWLFLGAGARAIHGIIAGAFHTYFPWYASEVAGLQAWQIGTVQAVLIGTALLARGASGVLLQRPKLNHLHGWMMTWTASACLMLFLSSQFKSFHALLGLAFGLGASEGFTYVLSLVHASDAVGKKFFATAISLLGNATDVGLLVGRFIPGGLMALLPLSTNGSAYGVAFGFVSFAGLFCMLASPVYRASRARHV